MLEKMYLCWGYIWLFLGSDRGLKGPQMCDLGSLGMFEIDLCRGVVLGMT